ncbi:response regulator transcription factor [Sinanaerobacter chloroacetimidivorans]|uniref:Stage 0 sporulation protein A homolog n=1 Tax=Sinanaerobacter chloroacetimidivorans TaxID=2818044 RepID=A0A8J7W6B9_9FIRM|nr:response regulator transcription factor [Sinanaerobacter chloroacetimidivorans]MBR0599898.1 response regulator transcription factor [Sinanaerobacter chloroacetimidivorans]
MEKKTILIVDDEIKILILLKDFLEAEGFLILTAQDGKAALEVFQKEQGRIDFIVLDVMMPEMDGWTLCREIRKQSMVPILMLTAKCEDYDEVHCFKIGADDYVPKPVRPAALIARIHALFRRSAAESADANILRFAGLQINKDSHIVTLEGNQITLSPKEYALLLLLAENKGKVISREQLLNQVWGYDYFGGLRTVDTHINRLRIKLENNGSQIATVRGYGYRFEE